MIVGMAANPALIGKRRQPGEAAAVMTGQKFEIEATS